MDYDKLYSKLFAEIFDDSGQANLHSDQQAPMAPMAPMARDDGIASGSLLENGLDGQGGDLQNSLLDQDVDHLQAQDRPHDHELASTAHEGKIFPSSLLLTIYSYS